MRSVYVGGKRQIAKKMADKREVLGGLGLGGQSPESLSIAEYLAVLGNVSSRPAPPSSEALKADKSVDQSAPEIKDADQRLQLEYWLSLCGFRAAIPCTQPRHSIHLRHYLEGLPWGSSHRL